jgi:hypothetical protein
MFEIGKNCDKVNEWLEQNPNITVISANSVANHGVDFCNEFEEIMCEEILPKQPNQSSGL